MLDPRAMASIADLELVARLTVDGTISGLHRSPFHGYSAEFTQYRHYRPGDDLKHVDWKLLARTDRIYTKQYRETTNLPAVLAFDASASMGFRGAGGVSKLEYARVLSAALAFLLSGQGDEIGLTAFDDGVRVQLPVRTGAPHLRRVLAALAGIRPSGRTAAAAALRRTIDLLQRRSLLFVFSDLYDENDEVSAELRRAARSGHEVGVFHVLTPEEIAFPYRGDIEFEDLESGEVVLTSAAGLAEEYTARMSVFREQWRSRCTAEGIDYTPASTDLPPDQVLRTYLLKRPPAAR
jgi:uncharacterized protein (DUF58 family)